MFRKRVIDMAIELKRLIEKVKHKDITLVAGKGGESNIVSWVHMVETIEAADFLVGGEIAVLTGIGLTKEADLTELAKRLYDHNAAGIVVNIGPYIECIPENAIEFCNSVNLPLYVVPWKIHLAEIIRIICFAITKDDQRTAEVTSAFRNAILFPKQEELYMVALSQRHFNVNWSYSIGVMRFDMKSGNRMNRIEKLAEALDIRMKHYYSKFAVFANDDELIMVMADMSIGEQKQFVEKAKESLRMLLIPEEKISIGIGRMTKSVRCLYKSYNQARAIQKLHISGKIDCDEIFYSDLGIYRLLMGIEDMDIVKEYYQCTLGPLVEYDRTNDTDLCYVLGKYLNNEGSVKDTAEELYVHRNTINYKLGKIKQILNMDISSTNARVELMIALTLKDILA